MEKLIEMANAGVGITLYGPKALGTYQNDWALGAKREDNGVMLEITERNLDLPTAINDLYEKWVAATRGLPNHGLRQIEHIEAAPPPYDQWEPTKPDDEIIF